MAFPPLISQADLELRVGARRIVELTDDDADGVADEAPVAAVIQAASDRAGGKLLAAWSLAQIIALAAEDSAVRAAVVSVALGYLGERRPEFTDAQGRTLYSAQRADGLSQLDDIVRAKTRSVGEEKVGVNRTLGTRVSRQRPPTFTFAATGRDPKGPGGF